MWLGVDVGYGWVSMCVGRCGVSVGVGVFECVYVCRCGLCLGVSVCVCLVVDVEYRGVSMCVGRCRVCVSMGMGVWSRGEVSVGVSVYVMEHSKQAGALHKQSTATQVRMRRRFVRF